MTLDEILTHCKKHEALGSSVVTFILPGNVRTFQRRLAGKDGGPLGRTVSQTAQGDLVMFDRIEVQLWIQNKTQTAVASAQTMRIDKEATKEV